MNGAHTATEHQYSAVRQVLQSEETGEEIRPDEMVKGYEIAPNEFAAIDPQEIKAAEIETSDTIDLFHFVKATKVDPIYLERSYYVAPEPGAEKGYALLLEAMRKEECLGIARIGMHRREHILILRPSEDYLVAYTMFYANEVRPAPRIDLPAELSNKELSMATALVKGYEGDFDPEQFKDLYQERVRNIIEAQLDRRFEMHPAPSRPTSGAPDLIEQIRLSLAQIESKKADANPSKKPARKTPTVAKKKPQRVRA
jgi:DNA end-binding protein Ku